MTTGYGDSAEVREMLSPSLNVRENRALASEIKFVVTAEQAEGIAGWARTRLGADPNAGGENDVYRITSLYFDTDGFDVFHRNGSFGRGKYRVRRYDTSKSAFLERKLKTHNLVCKRRTKVKIREHLHLHRWSFVIPSFFVICHFEFPTPASAHPRFRLGPISKQAR